MLFWASVSRVLVGQMIRSTSENFRVCTTSTPLWTVVFWTVESRALMMAFLGSTIGFGGMAAWSILKGSLTSQRSPPLKTKVWPKAGATAQRAATARELRMTRFMGQSLRERILASEASGVSLMRSLPSISTIKALASAFWLRLFARSLAVPR